MTVPAFTLISLYQFIVSVFNPPPTPEIYTLSLHDALPISCPADAKVPAGTVCRAAAGVCDQAETCDGTSDACQDRKSTRLNSSHITISYAVFCLKKKKHDRTVLPGRLLR